MNPTIHGTTCHWFWSLTLCLFEDHIFINRTKRGVAAPYIGCAAISNKCVQRQIRIRKCYRIPHLHSDCLTDRHCEYTVTTNLSLLPAGIDISLDRTNVLLHRKSIMFRILYHLGQSDLWSVLMNFSTVQCHHVRSTRFEYILMPLWIGAMTVESMGGDILEEYIPPENLHFYTRKSVCSQSIVMGNSVECHWQHGC